MDAYKKKYLPEEFAEKMFDAIIYYARENDKAFKENISRDYHATLFMTFFLIYGIDLVNYFLINKYGKFNREISNKLFSIMTDKIDYSFPDNEAEMIKDCVSIMEDKIIEALKIPFDDGINNPFRELALYIPNIIDIRDAYDKQYANQLLFNCLGETFTSLGKLVNENELKY